MGEASALLTLSDLLCELGRFVEALELNRRALDLTRETGSRIGEAQATATYGNKFLTLGRPTEALEFFRRGLDLARQTRFRQLEASALGNLGDSYAESERTDEAREHFRQSLALSEEIGYQPGVTFALIRLGKLEADAGRLEEATRALDGAARLSRELGIPGIQVQAAARRALLPGGDPRAASELLNSLAPRIGESTRLHAQWWLWLATHDRTRLEEAGRLVDALVAKAPPEYRTSIVEGVRVHRAILWAVQNARSSGALRQVDQEGLREGGVPD